MVKKDDLPYSTILVIDSSQRDQTALALITTDETTFAKEGVRAQELPKLINTLLERHKLLPKNIDAVGLVKKEGSMTAVRIGTATANTFAWINKLPIIEIEADNIEEAIKNISSGKVIKTSLPLQ